MNKKLEILKSLAITLLLLGLFINVLLIRELGQEDYSQKVISKNKKEPELDIASFIAVKRLRFNFSNSLQKSEFFSKNKKINSLLKKSIKDFYDESSKIEKINISESELNGSNYIKLELLGSHKLSELAQIFEIKNFENKREIDFRVSSIILAEDHKKSWFFSNGEKYIKLDKLFFHDSEIISYVFDTYLGELKENNALPNYESLSSKFFTRDDIKSEKNNTYLPVESYTDLPVIVFDYINPKKDSEYLSEILENLFSKELGIVKEASNSSSDITYMLGYGDKVLRLSNAQDIKFIQNQTIVNDKSSLKDALLLARKYLDKVNIDSSDFFVSKIKDYNDGNRYEFEFYRNLYKFEIINDLADSKIKISIKNGQVSSLSTKLPLKIKEISMINLDSYFESITEEQVFAMLDKPETYERLLKNYLKHSINEKKDEDVFKSVLLSISDFKPAYYMQDDKRAVPVYVFRQLGTEFVINFYTRQILKERKLELVKN